MLPALLEEKHHILFRFYHVSCEGSKSSSGKKKDGIEMPVGYSWVPLLHSGGRYVYNTILILIIKPFSKKCFTV